MIVAPPPSEAESQSPSTSRTLVASASGSASASALPCLLDAVTEKKYIQAYFDGTNSFTTVFLHEPSLLGSWSQGRLDPNLTKAVCAIGKLRIDGPEDEVARSWMREARAAVLHRLNRVSLVHLQALVLVVEYCIQTGETVEAWNLLSLSARLGFALKLNYERPELDPVSQECHRRLQWAIYLLDTLCAGGVEELTVCPAEYIHIRLPCDDRSFERGLRSKSEYLSTNEQQDGVGDMDATAYLVRLAWIRERTLR
jgi:hypothetical protein